MTCDGRLTTEKNTATGGLVVLGLGNPIRRDDAVGLEVVRRAKRGAAAAAAGVAVCFKECCSGAFDLLPEVEGHDALVVVDAWHTEQATPGRVRVLRAAELGGLAGAAPANPHLVALPQALAWAEHAGLHPPWFAAAVVVEVGEACLEFGEGLTEPVSAAVPAAVNELERVIRDVAAELKQRSCQCEGRS